MSSLNEMTLLFAAAKSQHQQISNSRTYKLQHQIDEQIKSFKRKQRPIQSNPSTHSPPYGPHRSLCSLSFFVVDKHYTHISEVIDQRFVLVSSVLLCRSSNQSNQLSSPSSADSQRFTQVRSAHTISYHTITSTSTYHNTRINRSQQGNATQHTPHATHTRPNKRTPQMQIGQKTTYLGDRNGDEGAEETVARLVCAASMMMSVGQTHTKIKWFTIHLVLITHAFHTYRLVRMSARAQSFPCTQTICVTLSYPYSIFLLISFVLVIHSSAILQVTAFITQSFSCRGVGLRSFIFHFFFVFFFSFFISFLFHFIQAGVVSLVHGIATSVSVLQPQRLSVT